MSKKKHKLIWILVTISVFIVCLNFALQDFISLEVHKFKKGLEIKTIIERTKTCSNYLPLLKKVIYPEDNSTSYKLSFREDRSIAKLALAFVVHDQPGLFEILFHLTFRPYNDYCIYIDAKTSKEIKRAFENIVNCYQEIFPSTNIILIKDTHQISWGTYSLLDADLTCLQKLIESDRQWDYFLNLAGTELPLQNLDDFSLKLANSRVNFSLFSFFEPTLKEERLKFAIKEIIQRPAASRSYKTYVADNRYNSYERTEILRPPPPYNLTIYKGWKNVILSRKFAKFALSHPIAQNLKEWTKDMEIPDEEFFPTLARITKYHQLPNGNFNITQNHQDELSLVKGLCPRITFWSTSPDYECHGSTIRDICHLSLHDLKRVYELNTLKNGDQDCFVANKFNLEVDPRPILSLARYLSPFVTTAFNLHLNDPKGAVDHSD